MDLHNLVTVKRILCIRLNVMTIKCLEEKLNPVRDHSLENERRCPKICCVRITRVSICIPSYLRGPSPITFEEPQSWVLWNLNAPPFLSVHIVVKWIHHSCTENMHIQLPNFQKNIIVFSTNQGPRYITGYTALYPLAFMWLLYSRRYALLVNFTLRWVW